MARPVAVMDRAAAPAACSQVTPGRLQLHNEKGRAALVISGLFLFLVGIALTTLNWHSYIVNTALYWTQLLGPFLIIAGSVFIITGFYTFGHVSCEARDEDVTESSRRTFTLSPRDMLHNNVACVPPYDFMRPALGPAAEVSRDAPATDSELPPQYGIVCTMVCTDHRAPEGTEANARSQKTLEEVHSAAEASHTCESPPAYEDIYPEMTHCFVRTLLTE